MPWFFKKVGCLWLILFISFVTSAFGQTPASSGTWQKPRNDNPTLRSLTYTSSANLLGKKNAFTVDFFCDPNISKNSAGALGFDLIVDKALLPGFNFEAFEGPDAVASGKKLMQITILQQGKSVLTINSELSGSTPDTGRFNFGVSDLSRAANSTTKSVLKKLGEDVDTLLLTVTDHKNPKLKLAFSIPVSGKQADFKALFAGVK